MAQAEHVVNAIRTLITDAGAKPSTSILHAAYAELGAALTEHPPRPIPVDVDAIDLEDHADHLHRVIGALSVYVTMILADTAQSVPSGLDLRYIQAALSDLASDVTGTIQQAAEGLAGRVS